MLSKFGKASSYATRTMYQSDYLHYSLHNPLELFTSNFDLFSSINHWIANTNYFSGNGGEFTYRIGFSIIIFIALFIVLYRMLFGKIISKKLFHLIVRLFQIGIAHICTYSQFFRPESHYTEIRPWGHESHFTEICQIHPPLKIVLNLWQREISNTLNVSIKQFESSTFVFLYL